MSDNTNVTKDLVMFLAWRKAKGMVSVFETGS